MTPTPIDPLGKVDNSSVDASAIERLALSPAWTVTVFAHVVVVRLVHRYFVLPIGEVGEAKVSALIAGNRLRCECFTLQRSDRCSGYSGARWSQ